MGAVTATRPGRAPPSPGARGMPPNRSLRSGSPHRSPPGTSSRRPVPRHRPSWSGRRLPRCWSTWSSRTTSRSGTGRRSGGTGSGSTTSTGCGSGSRPLMVRRRSSATAGRTGNTSASPPPPDLHLPLLRSATRIAALRPRIGNGPGIGSPDPRSGRSPGRPPAGPPDLAAPPPVWQLRRRFLLRFLPLFPQTCTCRKCAAPLLPQPTPQRTPAEHRRVPLPPGCESAHIIYQEQKKQ